MLKNGILNETAPKQTTIPAGSAVYGTANEYSSYIYIEKDYWVTFALYTIFHDPIGKETVFKGGTALSKCFGLIERFSEDIDLVVVRHEGESNNKITNKIKEISKVVSAVLPEVEIQEVTQKRGMNRKTAHTFAKEFQDNYGQVRDVIIVEATCLGYFEPSITKMIGTFIYDMMIENGQESMTVEYGILPFEVLALEPVRTLAFLSLTFYHEPF